jgi:hypothetical protein
MLYRAQHWNWHEREFGYLISLFPCHAFLTLRMWDGFHCPSWCFLTSVTLVNLQNWKGGRKDQFQLREAKWLFSSYYFPRPASLFVVPVKCLLKLVFGAALTTNFINAEPYTPDLSPKVPLWLLESSFVAVAAIIFSVSKKTKNVTTFT